ncbi:phosphorylase family protein [Azospirillum sp. sgz302134]
MTAEARIARRTGLTVACAGADPTGAAEALLDAGASGVISFGIAGGLAPEIRPGTLVIATGVVGDGTAYMASSAWRERLLQVIPTARAGVIASVARPVVTVAEKGALHARTGALAVDMESLAVARVCRERGVPFAVLRAVADPAHRALPPAALAGLDGGGRMAPGAVLSQLRDDPRQVVGLVRLGWDLTWALAALRAAARAFPRGGLGFDPAERVGDVA